MGKKSNGRGKSKSDSTLCTPGKKGYNCRDFLLKIIHPKTFPSNSLPFETNCHTSFKNDNILYPNKRFEDGQLLDIGGTNFALVLEDNPPTAGSKVIGIPSSGVEGQTWSMSFMNFPVMM